MYTGLRFIQAIVDFFVGVAEIILGLRVIFRLFAANIDNSFVNWIYQTSDVLMAPFRGIFPQVTLTNGHVLDISALFAMLVWAVVGYVVLALIGMLPVPSQRRYFTRRTAR
ncbi:YggT family protein [Candidatus Saccharibacteria bacterium]|nr:YggT family protein [Candidatus Saccharibacteria bacterium]